MLGCFYRPDAQVIMSKKLAPEFNVGWLIDSQSNTPKNILELLLDNNINIGAELIDNLQLGVDTHEDIELVRQVMKKS